MKRIALRVLALLLTAGVLLVPVLIGLVPSASTTTPDPVSITNYAADYVVSADGTLAAKEVITADFPFGRHGIFRFWDLADPSDSRVRLVPKDIKVTLDGNSVPNQLLWENGRRYRVAKIGDPDNYVSAGPHTYTITYTIKGSLSPTSANPGRFESSSWTDKQKAESVFNWNVVAPGWQMDIQKSTINITLPKPSGKVQCTSSFDGTGPCTIAGAGTDRVTISTGPLAPRTPVTVRIGLPTPPPDRVSVPWPVAYDRVLGRSLPVVGILLGIAALALAFGYALDRKSREPEPGFPVMYEPPKGLGPVQTAYITTESAPSRSLVATLLYQAEQGLTKITENGTKSWTITGTGDAAAWGATDDVTRFVGEGLGVTSPGSHFKASNNASSGLTLQRVKNGIEGATSAWATGIGASRTASAEWLARAAVIVAGIATIVLAIFIRPPVTLYV
ncbi:MAG: DUF2207 domain-containing protein, partial [Aeromicrobium sp.]